MYCIEECRTLYQQLGSLCKTPLTPQLVVNTADKLIYNYAVEQVCCGRHCMMLVTLMREIRFFPGSWVPVYDMVKMMLKCFRNANECFLNAKEP